MFSLLVWTALLLQPPDTDVTTVIRQHLEQLAIFNPALEAAQQQVRAAQARAEAAGNLPDPQLKAGLFLEPLETRVGAQNFRLGISQRLPTLRKWRSRKAVGDARILVAAEQLRSLLLQLETQFLQSLADWYYLQRTKAIHQEHQQLLRSLESVSGERYRINQAGYQDLINIQIELDRLQDLIESVELMIPQREATLNRLLGRDPREPLNLDIALPDLQIDDDALPSEPVAHHPQLRVAINQAKLSQQQLDLTKLDRVPDVTVGLEWMQTDEAIMATPGSGDDPVVLTVGVNLPVWRGQLKARERAVAAEIEGYEAKQHAIWQELVNTLTNARFQYRDAARRYRLYQQQIMPKAQEALEVTLAAFENGKTNFSAVIDAEEALLDFQLTLEKAQMERFKAWATIRAASADVNVEVF